MIQNYELKKELLENGTYDNFRLGKRELNNYTRKLQNQETDTPQKLKMFLQDTNFYYEMEEIFTSQENYKSLFQIYKARQNRVKRMSDKIDIILNKGDCGFITLTFKNEVLENTNEQTRRKYVTRYLKNEFVSYVANIDYGAKNGREHYHAVVLFPKNYKIEEEKLWKYGFFLNKSIKNKDAKALATYIGKLKSHALKKSGCRFIYSVDLKIDTKPNNKLKTNN